MHYTITPLLVGVRNVDQGIMTYQRGYGKRIWLPMYAFLVRGGGKTVLIDTGLEDFMTPPEFTRETGLTPQYMDEALAEAGVAPEAVNIVINTHLHDDHCGNNRLFTRAAFFIQQREIDFCRRPHPVDYRYDTDYIDDLDLHPLEGDAQILPGIDVFLTPGHTPGCQTVVVQTGNGPAVVTGMCCHNENFPAAGPAVCPGVHTDAMQAYDSAQRIQSMPGTLLPLHELSVAGKVL